MAQLTFSTEDVQMVRPAFYPTQEAQSNFIRVLRDDLATQLLASDLFNEAGKTQPKYAPPFNFSAQNVAKWIAYYAIFKTSLSSSKGRVEIMTKGDVAKDILGLKKTLASATTVSSAQMQKPLYILNSSDTFIRAHYDWLLARGDLSPLSDVTLSDDDKRALQFVMMRLFDLLGTNFGQNLKELTALFRSRLVEAVTQSTRVTKLNENTFKVEETGQGGYNNVISETSNNTTVFKDVVNLVLGNPSNISGRTVTSSRTTGVTTAGQTPFGSWQALFDHFEEHIDEERSDGTGTPWLKVVTAATESQGTYITGDDLMDNADWGVTANDEDNAFADLDLEKDKVDFNFGEMLEDAATNEQDAHLYKAYYRTRTTPSHEALPLKVTLTAIRLAHIWTYENAASGVGEYDFVKKKPKSGIDVRKNFHLAPGITKCAGVEPTKDGLSGTAPLTTLTWFDNYLVQHSEDELKNTPTLERQLLINFDWSFWSLARKIIDGFGRQEEYYFRLNDDVTKQVIWTQVPSLTFSSLDRLVADDPVTAGTVLTEEELAYWGLLKQHLEESEDSPLVLNIWDEYVSTFLQGYVPGWLEAMFAELDGPQWVSNRLPKSLKGEFVADQVIPTSLEEDPFTHTMGVTRSATELSAYGEYATVRKLASEYDELGDAERGALTIKQFKEKKQGSYWWIILIVLAIVVALIVVSQQKQRIEITDKTADSPTNSSAKKDAKEAVKRSAAVKAI